MKQLTVTPNDKGQRLDKLLLKYLNKAPKSFIYKMLRKKNIKLNNGKATGSEIINEGDEITLYLSDETLASFMSVKSVEKAERKFDIIYEDDNVLIANKPTALAVQRDKQHTHNTLNDQLLYYLTQSGAYTPTAESTFTPSICNRLDFNTAGLVVMGKNPQATRELNRIFRERLVDKLYQALVLGRVREAGSVEGYQSKSDDNIVTLSPNSSDKSAYVLTHYKPICAADGYTLLEIKLETGKSHQIRVALSSINHPIAGDPKYGRAEVNKLLYKRYRLGGQVLHSTKLIFRTDGMLSYLNDRVFKAPTPPIFDKIYKDVLSYEDN